MRSKFIPNNFGFALLLFMLAGFMSTVAEAAVSGAVDRRVALIIGNTDYEKLPQLKNAAKDAAMIQKTLEKANFEITLGLNLKKEELENKVRQFIRTLNDGDVALFYYSGHAIQVGGINYILSTDTNLSSEYDLEIEAYNLNNLLKYMQEASSLQIAVLDACRNNPFRERSYFVGNSKLETKKEGLASIAPRRGSLIVYSTAPDKVAYDGRGDSSPFAASFTDKVLTPNKEVRQILTDIRNSVVEKTNGLQVPWDVSSLTSPFYFITRRNVVIYQELTEIHVEKTATDINLEIPIPFSTTGDKLTANFRSQQNNGALMLDGKLIDPSSEIAASELPKVSFRSTASERPVELIHYTINNPNGSNVSGIVTVIRDLETKIAATQENQAKPLRQKLMIQDNSNDKDVEGVEPARVFLAADVGAGFIKVPHIQISDSDTSNEWLRLTTRDPNIQIIKGNLLISEGDLISRKELASLSIRPALASAGTKGKIIITPVEEDNPVLHPVVITMSANINACDIMAGQPFDIQGVTDGVLPNDIKLNDAEQACISAIKENPAIARYSFQYGRVLFAKGDYQNALMQFQMALDGGHVRAGYSIGRLYQLGSGVPTDPAKAVSLFQIGSQRGDPYAQYSLGKAKLSGKGTDVEIETGMALLIKASQSGHTYALNQLGSEYLRGKKIAKDTARAFRFFSESARRGDIWGKVNLGFLYRDGIHVEKDIARATGLFEQAYKDGHPYAGTLIGLLNKKSGGKADELLPWFRESANRGDAWGAYYAANLLVKNPKLLAFNSEALRLYAISASHKTKGASDRALKAVAKFKQRDINREIQRTMQTMSGNSLELDGILGPKSREIAAGLLNESPSPNSGKLLIQLVRQQWLNDKPRLDLL